jgi:hypothetical protein
MTYRKSNVAHPKLISDDSIGFPCRIRIRLEVGHVTFTMQISGKMVLRIRIIGISEFPSSGKVGSLNRLVTSFAVSDASLQADSFADLYEIGENSTVKVFLSKKVIK